MATLLGFTVPATATATYLVPGSSVRLTVLKEIAPLLIGFAASFHQEVEELIPGQCGGFNPRKIAGTSTWSRHAFGGAIDLNWLRHPMGRRNTFTAAQRRAIDDILDRYRHKGVRLLRAGKDYVNVADDMHFEVNVSRSTALAAVKALQSGGKPATGPKPGSRTLRVGATGPDVAFVQRWVGDNPDDGRFDAVTRQRVVRYQRIVGVKQDGVVGPATWGMILGR